MKNRRSFSKPFTHVSASTLMDVVLPGGTYEYFLKCFLCHEPVTLDLVPRTSGSSVTLRTLSKASIATTEATTKYDNPETLVCAALMDGARRF